MEERLDNGRGAEFCPRTHGDALQPTDTPWICRGSKQTAWPVGSVREKSGNHSKVLINIMQKSYHETALNLLLSPFHSLPPSTQALLLDRVTEDGWFLECSQGLRGKAMATRDEVLLWRKWETTAHSCGKGYNNIVLLNCVQSYLSSGRSSTLKMFVIVTIINSIVCATQRKSKRFIFQSQEHTYHNHVPTVDPVFQV